MQEQQIERLTRRCSRSARTRSGKWDEDNQALVDTHTSYLQEPPNEYDRKMEDEQEMQRRRLADEKEAMMGRFVKRKTHARATPTDRGRGGQAEVGPRGSSGRSAY